MLFIYPSDYFDHAKPDPVFEAEHKTACEVAGGENVVCLNFDRFLDGKDPFTLFFDVPIPAVWRGWQMTIDNYRRFFDYADKHNIQLTVTLRQYEHNHFLFHSFSRIGNKMSDTVFVGGNDFDVSAIRDAMAQVEKGGKVFVKDYVKGRRGIPCVLDDSMSDSEILTELNALLEDRGGDYAGGIAIRSFEPVHGETRFMVIDGKIAAYGSHFSDTAEVSPNDLADLDLCLAGAGSPFYSLDAAFTDDGNELRIIETGDGQVSECPEGQERKLIEALNRLG